MICLYNLVPNLIQILTINMLRLPHILHFLTRPRFKSLLVFRSEKTHFFRYRIETANLYFEKTTQLNLEAFL